MNMHTLQFMAAESHAASGGILGVLGIDWMHLLLQTLGFLALVFILGKFVYPHLLRAVDEREKTIASSVKAAHKAEERAQQAQKEVADLLKNARKEASEIVAVAKKEATATVESAEDKAKKRAEHIVTEAQEQLDQEVSKARAALHKETAELVALATGKIVREKIDTARDGKLIEAAIKEAK